jgi:hypothetical protein
MTAGILTESMKEDSTKGIEDSARILHMKNYIWLVLKRIDSTN